MGTGHACDEPVTASLLILQADPVVQDALGALPWGAARALIGNVTERARAIFPRLSAAQRRMPIAVETVVGRVPG